MPLAADDYTTVMPSTLQLIVAVLAVLFGAILFAAGVAAGRMDREQRRVNKAYNSARVTAAAKLREKPPAPDPVAPVDEPEGRHRQRYDCPRQPQLLPRDDWPTNRETP